MSNLPRASGNVLISVAAVCSASCAPNVDIETRAAQTQALVCAERVSQQDRVEEGAG
jgi:hypothetical protein